MSDDVKIITDYVRLKRVLNKKSATESELGSAYYDAKEQYNRWDTILQDWDLYYKEEIERLGFEKAHKKCTKEANKEVGKWSELYRDLEYRVRQEQQKQKNH